MTTAQRNASQHNRCTQHTADCNTTQPNATQPGDTTNSRSLHNATQRNNTTHSLSQHNTTQHSRHNMTKLQTDMKYMVELVDRPKTPRKNLVKKRCRYRHVSIGRHVNLNDVKTRQRKTEL